VASFRAVLGASILVSTKMQDSRPFEIVHVA
jgi:hypothetical protein